MKLRSDKGIFREIKSLGASAGKSAILYLLVAIFFFVAGPAGTPLARLTLSRMKKDLVPEEVDIVSLGPLDAFSAHIFISLALAAASLLPFGLFFFYRYLRPALLPRERITIASVLGAAGILFLAGSMFAYAFVIPSTFRLLYSFAGKSGFVSLFDVSRFVSSSFGLMAATGALFTLPVVMILLSGFGIVSRAFWIRAWKHALVAILIFTAVITPDGSGITMAVLALPLGLLYLAGGAISFLWRGGMRRGTMDAITR